MITYSISAETAYNVSRQLNTSLDLDEVLGRVLRITVEATGAKSGSLFLLDEQGQVTRHILARKNQSPEVMRRNVDVVMERGLAGWVYRHQYGALAADTTKDERWVRLPNDEEITGSALVVPLLYQERVNGLLALHHKQIGFFDESHLALAAGIAGQAAIALENARLFTQVKSERENLFAMIDAMPNPVLVVDSHRQVTFTNQAARQSLQLKQTDAPLSSFEGGQELELALAALEDQPDDHIEVEWPDGRVFNVSLNQVPPVGTVVALDDITYLKELDAMKTQFVETVSHDLKNPLSVIMGFIQLLEVEEDLSDSGRRGLQGIIQSAEHMNTLITDLLDLARIEAGMDEALEPNDMGLIVREAIYNFDLQLDRKQMELATKLPETPMMVLGDRVRLSQIVTNYLSNAIKYTPAEGQIEIRLKQKSDELWLSVTDNGPGISPARRSQLFQKFYRVPEVQQTTDAQGTGLGLSIVKAIVEGYGGRVWVESEVGVGSTFGCVLPLHQAAPAEAGDD